MDSVITALLQAKVSGEFQKKFGETQQNESGEIQAKLSGETQAKLSGEIQGKLSGETQAKISEESEAKLSGDESHKPDKYPVKCLSNIKIAGAPLQIVNNEVMNVHDFTKYDLNETLKFFNVKLRIIEGDGNCLYRCFSMHLYGSESLHRRCREEIATYVAIFEYAYTLMKTFTKVSLGSLEILVL